MTAPTDNPPRRLARLRSAASNFHTVSASQYCPTRSRTTLGPSLSSGSFARAQLDSPPRVWLPLFVCLAAIIASPLVLLTAVGNQSLLLVFTAGLLILGGLVALFGFMAVAPNHARVLLLFGDYKGSVKDSGFFWVNPFFSKKKVSLRIRNFDVAIQSESALRNLASRHP